MHIPALVLLVCGAVQPWCSSSCELHSPALVQLFVWRAQPSLGTALRVTCTAQPWCSSSCDVHSPALVQLFVWRAQPSLGLCDVLLCVGCAQLCVWRVLAITMVQARRPSTQLCVTCAALHQARRREQYYNTITSLSITILLPHYL